VTADDRAVGSVILEVRAGTGGAEAALWAGDLFEMYQRYAVGQSWSFDVMTFSPGEQGGLRHAVASVRGVGVWQGLGYEGGVHCVKRVPTTEAQGRVHTSTATVAVLPEPDRVQIDIPESEVQIHVTTSQGPGGQNVNKVATAVHLVHLPTGIEVRMQESKSQQQNRVKAWQLLRARVYDHYQRIKDAERAQERSKMIGSAGRSERIRTYRAKESVAVDHRLNQSFGLRGVLDGGLDEVVAALIARDRTQRIAAL
jgi:peptide chain release factor 1